jgi:hypothetical protein
MSDANGPNADHQPRWRQHNAATGGGTVFGVQGGNIIFSGQPGASPQVHEREESRASGQIRVLMLAANPRSTARLAIDEEARQITERLRLSRDRDAFDLITCWAVHPMDLLQHLNQHSPHIVHFSGHGDRTGELLLSAGDGTDRPVTAAALAELFRVANDEIRIVVVNACHSATQIQAMSRYIDYVVGMRAPITDQAATIFAASFYSALGFRLTIPQAFEQAVVAMGLHGLVEHDVPELVVRPNANPQLTVRN